MNTAQMTAADPRPAAEAAIRPHTQANRQAERLAWLFRAGQADGRPHPLLQPVACLRGACDAAAAVPLHVAVPAAVLPQPRYTVDRLWLRDRVAHLPAWPQAVTAAIRVLARDDSTGAQCAEAVARDPALAVQVLRLANAACYGRAGRMASLRDAVALLGRQKLGMVLTAAAASGQFSQARCAGFDPRQFWREAFASGIAAQALALELGVDDGMAFSAGLLHDIGHLALVSQLPDAMAQVLASARLHDQPLQHAEAEVLGMDHAEAGALIASHWNFPPAMVAAIAGHHGPALAADEGGAVSLTDLVQAADAFAHALDLHQADTERVPALSAPLAQRLQLTPERCARVLATTEQGVDAVTRSLAL